MKTIFKMKTKNHCALWLLLAACSGIQSNVNAQQPHVTQKYTLRIYAITCDLETNIHHRLDELIARHHKNEKNKDITPEQQENIKQITLASQLLAHKDVKEILHEASKEDYSAQTIFKKTKRFAKNQLSIHQENKSQASRQTIYKALKTAHTNVAYQANLINLITSFATGAVMGVVFYTVWNQLFPNKSDVINDKPSQNNNAPQNTPSVITEPTEKQTTNEPEPIFVPQPTNDNSNDNWVPLGNVTISDEDRKNAIGSPVPKFTDINSEEPMPRGTSTRGRGRGRGTPSNIGTRQQNQQKRPLPTPKAPTNENRSQQSLAEQLQSKSATLKKVETNTNGKPNPSLINNADFNDVITRAINQRRARGLDDSSDNDSDGEWSD